MRTLCCNLTVRFLYIQLYRVVWPQVQAGLAFSLLYFRRFRLRFVSVCATPCKWSISLSAWACVIDIWSSLIARLIVRRTPLSPLTNSETQADPLRSSGRAPIHTERASVIHNKTSVPLITPSLLSQFSHITGTKQDDADDLNTKVRNRPPRRSSNTWRKNLSETKLGNVQ